MSKENSINIPIQYLRGVASILVVFAHFKLFPIYDFFCGAIGVDIFFIISGFIMAKGIQRFSENKFYFIVNRFIRILPLYLILSLPIFFLSLYHGNYKNVFTSLFFIGGTINHYQDPLLFSGWSLFFEFIFYFIFIIFSNSKKIILLILFFQGLIGLLLTIDNSAGFIFNQFYFLFAFGMLIEKLFDNKYLNINSTGFFLISVFLLFSVMIFNDYSSVFIDYNYIPRQFVYILDLQYPRVIIWGFVSVIFLLCLFVFFSKLKEKYCG
jgi:peptidoglycan/LPS O-acetylase OafA/YrhL